MPATTSPDGCGKTKCHQLWQVRSWDDRQHVAGTPWNKPKPSAIMRKRKTTTMGALRRKPQGFAWVAGSFEITKLCSHVVDSIKIDVCIEQMSIWKPGRCIMFPEIQAPSNHKQQKSLLFQALTRPYMAALPKLLMAIDSAQMAWVFTPFRFW